MTIHRFDPYAVLRQEAGEMPEGGGAAPENQATAAAPEPAAEESAPAEAPKQENAPGLLERVRAGLQGKGALLKRAETAEQALATANERAETLETELAQARARVRELEGERQEIEKALTTERERKDTAEEAAADILEQRGFQKEELPASESEAETVEGMMARLDTERDPKKRFELAKQINESRWASN